MDKARLFPQGEEMQWINMCTVSASTVVQYNSTFLTSIMYPTKTLLIERWDKACLYPQREEMQWINMRTVSAVISAR